MLLNVKYEATLDCWVYGDQDKMIHSRKELNPEEREKLEALWDAWKDGELLIMLILVRLIRMSTRSYFPEKKNKCLTGTYS